MGKGDKKSRRGKISKRSWGKSRPRPQKIRQRKKAAAKTKAKK